MSSHGLKLGYRDCVCVYERCLIYPYLLSLKAWIFTDFIHKPTSGMMNRAQTNSPWGKKKANAPWRHERCNNKGGG